MILSMVAYGTSLHRLTMRFAYVSLDIFSLSLIVLRMAFIIPHTISMGLRSGLLAGQFGMNSISFSSKKAMVFLAV